MAYIPPRNPRIPDPNQQLPVPMGNSPIAALMARQPTYSNPVSSGKYQDLAMRLAGTPPQLGPQPVMDLPPLRAAPNDTGSTTTTTPGLGSYLGTGLQAYQVADNLGLLANDPSQAETSAEQGARDTSGTNASLDANIAGMAIPTVGAIAGGAAIPAGTVTVGELGAAGAAGTGAGGTGAALGGGASADAAGAGLAGLGGAAAGLGGLAAIYLIGLNAQNNFDQARALREAQLRAGHAANGNGDSFEDWTHGLLQLPRGPTGQPRPRN